jgi:lipopolysaccharide/colanic/teichoic acid biosynthesis glycosyltransferase
MLDIGIAVFLLFCTLWMWAIIALLIKLNDGGDIFYAQKRVGKGKKVFTLFKFRTMRLDRSNTPTKIGKLLRYLHFDELPQLINVLRGDISFVGPRPEWQKLAEVYEKEIPFYFLRYRIKPGLTGWAQINYRRSDSIEEAKEKFQYDLYYLVNRSLVLDMEISLKTIQLIFREG